MLKYTKQQLQNRKLRQAVGVVVVVTVLVAAVFVTIAVVSDDTPEINNKITNESQ
jgi:hypothetical protein